MKQYLDHQQTAKLIELGFEKPRALVDKYYDFDAEAYAEVKTYSLGELIEILPNDFRDKNKNTHTLSIYTGELETWEINYIGFESRIRTCEYELIDAAFEMCVKLKEEGVI